VRQIRLSGWMVWFPMYQMWVPLPASAWEPVMQTKRIPLYVYDHEGD
jgi:hypothetical protein